MSGTISVGGAGLGTALQQMLGADDIQPGSDAGYQTCKTIYLYHPLGAKMVDSPINLAQSKGRTITVPDSPEERVVEQFEREWERLRTSEHIATAMSLARTYGIGSLGVGAAGVDPSTPLDLATLAGQQIFISTFDPLNTAGSLVLNQDPSSPDFQKVLGISVQGQPWHRSRAVVVMNEKPVYIAYTGSAFGFVGRSVYQRALFPLKSFINTMVTDDMVSRKAGLLIAKMKPAGSIVDRFMQSMAGVKRQMLRDGQTDNVLGITPDESIETLNLQNIDGAGKFARDNILTNIALASDMPAKLLNEETFAEGFGEGTEDAAKIVRYVEGIRTTMAPLYAFMDRVVQHRAWTPEFYRTIQADFPAQYRGVDFQTAFYRWQNSFRAEWPSLIEEPESEKVKVEKERYAAITDLLKTIMPSLDQPNVARAIQWAADNFNQNETLFSEPLDLDYEALAAHEPQPAMPPDAGEGGDAGGEAGGEAVAAEGDPPPTPQAASPPPARIPRAA